METFSISPKVLQIGYKESGKRYRSKVNVINVGKNAQRIHVLQPKEKEWKLLLEKKGAIRPGFSESVIVEFCHGGGLFREFESEFYVLTATEKYTVPLRAIPSHSVDLEQVRFIPKELDFGKQSVNVTKEFTIEFGVPVEYRWWIKRVTPGAKRHTFLIEPEEGVIPPNESMRICITFQPMQPETSLETIELHVDKPDFKPQRTNLVGSSILLEKKEKRSPITDIQTTLETSQMNQDRQLNLLSTQIKIHDALHPVKKREKRKSKKTSSTDKPHSKELPKSKEARLVHAASAYRKKQQEKEIKWFKEVGENPPSDQVQEKVLQDRQKTLLDHAVKRREEARCRKDTIVGTGKPIIKQSLKQKFYEESKAPEKAPVEKKVEIEKPPTPEKETKKKPVKKQVKKGKPVKEKEVVVKEPIESSPEPKVVLSKTEAELQNELLISDFKTPTQRLLVHLRIRRRLELLNSHSEEKEIMLALQEAQIPPLNPNLIKVTALPRIERRAKPDYQPQPYLEPVFKDLSLLKLKVPLYYKMVGYQSEPLVALNTYMKPETPIDFTSLIKTSFPIQKSTYFEANDSSFDTIYNKLESFIKSLSQFKQYYTETKIGSMTAHQPYFIDELNPEYYLASKPNQILLNALEAYQTSTDQTKNSPFVRFTTFSAQHELLDEDEKDVEIQNKNLLIKNSRTPLVDEDDSVKNLLMKYELQDATIEKKENIQSHAAVLKNHGFAELYSELEGELSNDKFDEWLLENMAQLTS